MIENWKVMARLSQTLVHIEQELNKVFQVASELADAEPADVGETPVLVAPTRSGRQSVSKPVEATPATVKVSAKKKAVKPVRTAAATPKTPAPPNVAIQADLAPTDVAVKSKRKAAARPKPRRNSAATPPNCFPISSAL